ncbi:hypothetical protein GCM10028796_37820 [Ramlibacter monticola]|uniref:Class I SAM-dependent methyltransferase n=1 Tax=Ramlibacter monticola TaxID=1926872 RepID=A0A936Z9I3_9BURK|nr:class I SAM-dependent methyltransferase [Ramlibacter monticola]MBL0395017.1 class I SAM-dependent methyltransferase [Ramlibacter monticola]
MVGSAQPVLRYEFIPLSECEMCGSHRHKLLGMRLNRSQGRSPRAVSGIAVGIKKCLDCELVFADPRPKPANLSDHYGVPPESYWTNPAQWEVPDSYFVREISEAKALIRFRPGMTALDVGAGLGMGMTALARAGFDVCGIEPSETFRARAIERMGIAADRLQLASVEDATYAADTFDLVTFGAVLEHLQEPGRCIARAMQWLKPGGVMQAEVPSSRWVVDKLANLFFFAHGLNYVSNLSPMHPPYHLYSFTPESFRKHAQRVGYEVVQHRIEVCTLYNVPGFLHPLLRSYMRATQTGMQLTVWLRKRPYSDVPVRAG